MSVTVAKNAGFCFGVKRATDRLEAAIEAKCGNERIFTLGNIIHNDIYNKQLFEKGVQVEKLPYDELLPALLKRIETL